MQRRCRLAPPTMFSRNRDERFDQRRKPEKVRGEVVSGGDQRNGMRDRKGSNYGNERAEAAKRDYQAKQKQQMVGAIKNVEKTQVDKSQGGLVPPRVESDEARIAVEFERANPAAGWQKAKNSDHAQAQPRHRRMDGKTGLLRLDRVFEKHVEHGLVPIDVRVIGQRWTGHVS